MFSKGAILHLILCSQEKALPHHSSNSMIDSHRSDSFHVSAYICYQENFKDAVFVLILVTEGSVVMVMT